MSRNDSDDVRFAAESINGHLRPSNPRLTYQQQSQFDINREHSINFISEDFLGGYMQDGRMSVVRRFFCLFVTFEQFFVSLLWLICIMITGDSIFNALQKQVVHYSIYTSLFDVVGTAIGRFIVLMLFYALFYTNHWLIIAMSTTFSCMFLISKVFYLDWVDSPTPIFGVVLVVTSFVLSWGEVWFFDCKVKELSFSSVGSSCVRSSKSPAKRADNSGGIFRTLSKSLGDKDFQGQLDFTEPPPLDDNFQDANVYLSTAEKKKLEQPKAKDKIYVSAAISIDFPGMPPVPKYTRGQNLVSCWAMREVDGKSDMYIFEWLLCLDLKGYMPRLVLDAAYTTFMTDYMTHLRKYVCELRQKRRKSAYHPALEDE